VSMTPSEIGIIGTLAAGVTALLPRVFGWFLGGKRRETMHEITAHMDRLEKDNLQLRDDIKVCHAREDELEKELRTVWRRTHILERFIIVNGLPIPEDK
jgi:hypothetical protein